MRNFEEMQELRQTVGMLDSRNKEKDKMIAELKVEVGRLQEGINDLRMYNGDQEEMSNIFARLK